MLDYEINALLTETISHLSGPNEAKRGDAIRAFKFKMINQGIARSSMFDQGYVKIHRDALEEYANDVWREMRSVLEQTGFDAPSGSEDDLIHLLNMSVASVYEADKRSLRDQKRFTAYAPETTLDLCYKSCWRS